MINLLKKHARINVYHFGCSFYSILGGQPWYIGCELGKEADWFKHGRNKVPTMADSLLMGWVYCLLFSLEGIMADDNGKNCLIGLQNGQKTLSGSI